MWKASASLFAALTAVAFVGQARAEAPEPVPTAQICDRAPGAWDDTAEANAISLYALEWMPFGPSELGWEAYVPLLQQEVGSPCDPTSAGFAEALAAFQGRYGLTASGRFDQATFQVLRGLWQERRPFVMAR
ncbi:peptidoglycan-binding domain-containing protein, partial [Brevundimonas sp.]|uniref:peptidoglycan-binding domain-containing protein n=2 Tax=Brevundimonas TaxID=41275 RepID=UPI000E7FF607